MKNRTQYMTYLLNGFKAFGCKHMFKTRFENWWLDNKYKVGLVIQSFWVKKLFEFLTPRTAVILMFGTLNITKHKSPSDGCEMLYGIKLTPKMT